MKTANLIDCKTTSNKSGLSFVERIKGLPNQQIETIKEIAKITMSTQQAVYKWLNEGVTPAKIKQKIIADYLGADIEELWPEKQEEHA